MLQNTPILHASLVRSDADLRAAQKLRYQVFVNELGGDGPGVDHQEHRETDHFDRYADHLILRDSALSNSPTDGVVGVYRLMTRCHAQQAGGFYSASEFDLTKLERSGKNLLELGRSCLHPAYRGGAALAALWQALNRYVTEHQIDILFGVASFHGTELSLLRQPISLLHATYLAPDSLRVTSRMPQECHLLPPDQIDRKAAMRQVPALIKSYLKLGGVIGQGAFVDHAFNTTDLCLILETAQLAPAKTQHVARMAS